MKTARVYWAFSKLAERLPASQPNSHALPEISITSLFTTDCAFESGGALLARNTANPSGIRTQRSEDLTHLGM